jgi:hypothetical protein
MSSVPVFLRAAMRAPVLLPKKVGALTHNLVKTLFRFGQCASIISIWSQSPAPADMRPGGQVVEVDVRQQLRVGSSLHGFRSIFRLVRDNIWRSDRDRIGV